MKNRLHEYPKRSRTCWKGNCQGLFRSCKTFCFFGFVLLKAKNKFAVQKKLSYESVCFLIWCLWFYIQVFFRARPMTPQEITAGPECIEIVDNEHIYYRHPKDIKRQLKYKFDHVFGPNADQIQVQICTCNHYSIGKICRIVHTTVMFYSLAHPHSNVK